MQELQEQTTITNREDFNQYDFNSYTIEKQKKPSQMAINQIRAIKKVRLENKQNSFIPQYCIENEIAKLLEDKNNIPIAIEKIKQMQKDKGIIEFERCYLNNILLNYSDMSLRTIQSRIKELLSKANVREGFKEYRCLCKNFNEVTYLIEDRTAILYSFI